MINQIAAGEVVERPASVVKELIENAIDAGASHIDVMSGAGGKNLIRITDDGQGMGADDLALAVERHCTSKISADLLDIHTLGFRGEALPSIGSVARLTITTRHRNEDNAWSIVVNGGKISPVQPAALSKGTVIEVAGLFSNVPARLKFLKSERAETNAITEIFKRMALAFPQIRFSICGEDRSALDYPSSDLIGRITQVLGPEFEKNALQIDAEREGFSLTGYAGLPTFNRGNALHQYFFVNGRPVRDKALLGAVRGAYSDFLAGGRHGVLVLFLECEPSLVDVNVHPAKAEVRFRDSALVRGLIVGSLKQAISGAGHRASSEGGRDMMAAFRPQGQSPQNTPWQPELSPYRPLDNGRSFSEGDVSKSNGFEEKQHSYDAGFAPSGQVSDFGESDHIPDSAWHDAHPLGAARAQLHENYIIAQTPDGLMIIDQHAAHERIVYEKLKAGMAQGVAGQMLLIPDVIDLAQEDVDRLIEQAEALAKFGL
ncbi:MAG: DNA mismatch repair endonuclease MutL, partial [Rhizobiaceae bacterium]|nr:DNA mismatch repair endonuclease MutL [Rhizobiaceae bacterium]